MHEHAYTHVHSQEEMILFWVWEDYMPLVSFDPRATEEGSDLPKASLQEAEILSDS